MKTQPEFSSDVPHINQPYIKISHEFNTRINLSQILDTTAARMATMRLFSFHLESSQGCLGVVQAVSNAFIMVCMDSTQGF